MLGTYASFVRLNSPDHDIPIAPRAGELFPTWAERHGTDDVLLGRALGLSVSEAVQDRA